MTDVRILLVESPADFEQVFAVEAAAFARQSQDGLWMTLHPGWDDPAVVPSFVRNRVLRWQNTTSDAQGRPNALFLKAVVSEPVQGSTEKIDKIVGTATWVQNSADPGFGDRPLTIEGHQKIFNMAFPEDEDLARFLAQALGGMQAFRRQVAEEKSGSAQPNWFVLDVCAVHPDYQGRGIAGKLVQWGLDEAERRGGLECTTEASAMGRRVYERLGFAIGPEIDYGVDDEFKDKPLPSNVIMRTRGGFSA